MSFLLNDDVKVTEEAFNRLFPELGRLAEEKDIDSLMAVRRKIHEEFLADAGEDEAKRKRLEGAQWKVDVRFPAGAPLDMQVSYVSAHMWDGAEVVKNSEGPGLGSF